MRNHVYFRIDFLRNSLRARGGGGQKKFTFHDSQNTEISCSIHNDMLYELYHVFMYVRCSETRCRVQCFDSILMKHGEMVGLVN